MFIKKDKSVIPKGDYCYTYKNDKFIVCPYWSRDRSLLEHTNGVCNYLNKSDLDINLGHTIELIRQGKLRKTIKIKTIEASNTYGMSLLWDQIKECGINLYTEAEKKEVYKLCEKRK